MGCFAPHQRPYSAVACCPLLLLTCGLRMTSSRSEGRDWKLVGRMEGFGEPTAVWPKDGGAPGDQGGVPQWMVRFDGPDPLRIDLMNITWTKASLSPPPLPPPPPPAPPPAPKQNACPAGWRTHTSGFWYNTLPCPKNDFGHCKEDAQNGTVTTCATKCTVTPGCVAFDACKEAGPCGCYIFVGGMVLPFTANAGSLTCVRQGNVTAL